MTGISTDSRLERLLKLRNRLDLEIRAERARTLTQAPSLPTPNPAAPEQRLRRRGITSLEVKQWALAQGLIDEIRRGRVSAELIDAYLRQHPSHSR